MQPIEAGQHARVAAAPLPLPITARPVCTRTRRRWRRTAGAPGLLSRKKKISAVRSRAPRLASADAHRTTPRPAACRRRRRRARRRRAAPTDRSYATARSEIVRFRRQFAPGHVARRVIRRRDADPPLAPRRMRDDEVELDDPRFDRRAVTERSLHLDDEPVSRLHAPAAQQRQRDDTARATPTASRTLARPHCTADPSNTVARHASEAIGVARA